MRTFDIDAESWAVLNRLLDEALDMAPTERAEWLDALNPQYDTLKSRLRELLSHMSRERETDLLQTIPKLEFSFTEDENEPDEQGRNSGTNVGIYRLVRRLDTGGMGAVWL